MPSLSGWFRMRHNWNFMLVGRRFCDFAFVVGNPKAIEPRFLLPSAWESKKYLRWNSLMINCNPSKPLRKSVWRRLNKAKTALRREGRSGCKEEAKKSKNIDNSINHFGFLLFLKKTFFSLFQQAAQYGVWACVRKISRSRLVSLWFSRKKKNLQRLLWLLKAGILTDIRSNSMRGIQQGQASIHSFPGSAYYRVTLSRL